MSRDLQSNVIYAKPNKTRAKHHQEAGRRDYDRHDPRAIPPREYQHGRPVSHEDHYNRHYRHPVDVHRHDDGGRPVPDAYREHHSRHYQLEQQPRKDRNQQQQQQQQQQRRDDSNGPPVFVHIPRGPTNRDPNHRSRDRDHHPLQQLFKPPPGTSQNQRRDDIHINDQIHAAEVHAAIEEVGPRIEPPRPPSPPSPPELLQQPSAAGADLRKPRKIREYRIRRNPRSSDEDDDGSDDSKSDDESNSDSDNNQQRGNKKKSDKKDKKDKKKKSHKLFPLRNKSSKKKTHRKESNPSPPKPDNWYQQTHPEKVIKIGDITYIRARAADKKWVERLMSAFEAFGFVIIGVIYKGGDAVLQIIAPIAVIKSYTALLGPALNSLVLGITAK